MTLTPAQFRRRLNPDDYMRILCTCDGGFVTRGRHLPHRCVECAGEGHVYVLRSKVSL